MSLPDDVAEVLGDVVFADGLEHALIGYLERFGQEPVALYDRARVVQGYVDEGMDLDEAEEFFSYNVLGAWVGDLTPAFATILRTSKDQYLETP